MNKINFHNEKRAEEIELLLNTKKIANDLFKLVTLADRDPVDVLTANIGKTAQFCEYADGDLYYSHEWEENGSTRAKKGDKVKAVRVKLDGTLDTDNEVTLVCETYPTEWGEPDDYDWHVDTTPKFKSV